MFFFLARRVFNDKPAVDFANWLLARPYATKIHFGLKPEEWEDTYVKWENIRTEDLLAMIPSDRRIWLVAETVDYPRGPVVIVLPYWEKLA